MLPEEQRRAFKQFYRSARCNKYLTPKETVLVHLASAMAFGCYP